LLTYFLNDFEMVPVAPIVTGITFDLRSTCAVFLYNNNNNNNYYYYYYYYYSPPPRPLFIRSINFCAELSQESKACFNGEVKGSAIQNSNTLIRLM
jgi:hypothetical protein